MEYIYHNIQTDGKTVVADGTLAKECLAKARELTNFLSSSPVTIVADRGGGGACLLTSTRDILRRCNNTRPPPKGEEGHVRHDWPKATFCADPHAQMKEYVRANPRSTYTTCLNTARDPREYGAMGMACVYDWKAFHMALDPDKSNIVERLASAALLYNRSDPDIVRQVAQYVYCHPCYCNGACQGRLLRTGGGGRRPYSKPLPALLPALFYDIDYITSDAEVFSEFVSGALAPVCLLMSNSAGGAPNAVRAYLVEEECAMDPYYTAVRVTFECVLDCICKKTAAVASDLYTMEVHLADETTPLPERQPPAPRDIFTHPEQLRFEGFPPEVMQQTRDFRLVGENTVAASYALPILDLILADHTISEMDKLVCECKWPAPTKR